MSQKKVKRERRENKQESVNVFLKPHKVVDMEEGKLKDYKKYNYLLIVVIFIIGIIIYSNSFDCSFHFDDDNIFKSSVTSSTSTISDWLRLFPSRPLGILTFALNYHFYHLDVWGYHLVNLIIHLTNAFLVWWLTWLSLSTPVMKNMAISKHKTMVSFLTGLLFVSHPLATQSVTYIAQRFASLATLFYLLSLTLFVKGRLWQGDRNTPWLLFGGSIICAVLGMLTKEIVFTLPFAILLYDYYFLKAVPWKPKINDQGLIISLIILVIFIFLFLKSFSLNDIFDTIPPLQGYTYSISAKEYLFTQFSVILTYLRLLVLPINQNIDYDYPVSYSLFEPATFVSFLVLIGIFAASIILFRRYRLISFGIIWFFLTISVESSIIPISQNVIFEHRTYLPSFGFFLALTSAVFYFTKERYFKIAVIIILITAAFNAGSTYQRNKIWKNESTLWTDCVKNSPNKARPHNNLGAALNAEGKKEQALAQYLYALKINPYFAEAHNNLGIVLADEGKINQAFEHFRSALKIKPDDDDEHYNLAKAFKEQGNLDEAIVHYREALRINPYYIKAHNNLAIILYTQNKHDEAIYHFLRALEIKPNDPDTHFNLGVALGNEGNLNEAIEQFRQAIYLQPDYEDARQALLRAVELKKRQKR